MEKKDILEEIMLNVQQFPLDFQERILDILKGMEFTNKCIKNNSSQNNKKNNE